jgi:1-acyl-sn-glycerol-3-phosphate acyltransferase
MLGWRIEGSLPPGAAKSVLIAAPHTSNWDLPYTLMVAFQLQLHIYWMGKASIFRWPFGPVMRWLGGIPVNRETSNNLVAASAAAITAADGPLQLVVPPEGTRGKTRHWKTGFYYIALQAGVPIVLAYMDYERKLSGLGPVFVPTGDIEADMAEIKRFYAPFKGRRAAEFSAD